MTDQTLALYIEVANEHPLAFEDARRIVAHSSEYAGHKLMGIASALVAIDDAMAEHNAQGAEVERLTAANNVLREDNNVARREVERLRAEVERLTAEVKLRADANVTLRRHLAEAQERLDHIGDIVHGDD